MQRGAHGASLGRAEREQAMSQHHLQGGLEPWRPLAPRARLGLFSPGVSHSPGAGKEGYASTHPHAARPMPSIPVPPTLQHPWGCDTQASPLHPLRQRFHGDGGYPKSSNGSGVARPALTAAGRLCTANQTHVILPSEGTRGVCVPSSLPGHPPLLLVPMACVWVVIMRVLLLNPCCIHLSGCSGHCLYTGNDYSNAHRTK